MSWNINFTNVFMYITIVYIYTLFYRIFMIIMLSTKELFLINYYLLMYLLSFNIMNRDESLKEILK